jgi:hypothetical protein
MVNLVILATIFGIQFGSAIDREDAGDFDRFNFSEIKPLPTSQSKFTEHFC